MPKTKNKNTRAVFIVLSFFYIAIFCFFYYKYVPLIKAFQIALMPVLFIMLITTSIKIEWGILFFIFAFPLINNLPYFFGIYGHIPHAPTALVLILVFFLGCLINKSFANRKFSFNHPVFRPLVLLSLVIFISGIITFFRYANFWPFLSPRIYELAVNVNMVSAGGAIMSDIFIALNYLTGFFFFAIIFNEVKSRDLLKKIVFTLSISIFLSLLFSLVQKYHSLNLGNIPYWVNINQLNSTFKDPNSFAACLIATLPIFLALFFASSKYYRLLLLFLILFALFIFPSTGSRSSFLGLVISLPVFFILLLNLKYKPKKKVIFAASVVLITSLAIVSLYSISKESNLLRRLAWSAEKLSEKDYLNVLFTGKVNLWTIARKMIKDYPLTGVGIGAFIVELPNYAKLMELPHKETDSAENYFLQAGSELGIIGLFLIFWVFYEIIRQMRKSWKEIPSDNEDKFILIGAISGLVSLSINYLFHSYIGSYEVKYTFWLLAALVFILPRTNGIAEKAMFTFKLGRNFKSMAIILAVTFGVVHLWNSARGLSINNRSEIFGWTQNFGLYGEENDNRGFSFRWAKKSAGIAAENIGTSLVIPMVASHPDLATKPVRVRIFMANQYFRKKALYKEVTFKSKEWRQFEIPISNFCGERIYLIFETDRAWQPLKYLNVPDARTLAIGLGKPWFRYPDELSEGEIKSVEKIAASNWGNPDLISTDTRQIKLKINEKKAALRLWIRGQKAFGIGPYIIIRLDNSLIGKTMLNDENWTPLIFKRDISIGEHTLSVEFTNDWYVPEKGQDRNVFLGDLEIIYLK